MEQTAETQTAEADIIQQLKEHRCLLVEFLKFEKERLDDVRERLKDCLEYLEV